jgi:hypothetical protein
MDGRSQAAERSKAASYGVQEEGPERALKQLAEAPQRGDGAPRQYGRQEGVGVRIKAE